MIARRPGARAATLALSAVSAFLLAFVAVVASPPAVRTASAQLPGWVPQDSALFEIYQDDRLLGTEEFRSFQTHDTLVVGSALQITGASPGSTLPRLKTATFLRRAADSYPLVFQIVEMPRDSAKVKSLNCVFSDTTVIIYEERGQLGSGTAVALPPGRLYMLEPGIYSQIQTLVGDFVRGTQQKRKQPVLIPSLKTTVDIHMTRGPKERLGQDGAVIEVTPVVMTDKLTQFVVWADDAGRMIKLEAKREGLRVERAVASGAPVGAPAHPGERAGGK